MNQRKAEQLDNEDLRYRVIFGWQWRETRKALACPAFFVTHHTGIPQDVIYDLEKDLCLRCTLKRQEQIGLNRIAKLIELYRAKSVFQSTSIYI